MKNRRTGHLQSLGAVTRIALLSLMLILCIGALSLVSFAEDASAVGGVESLSFADGVGVTYDSTAKYWGKTYDGTSEIAPENVVLSVVGQTEEKLPTVISAGFVAPNTEDAQTDVGAARLHIVYEWDGVEREYTAPARIEKRLLTWKGLSLNVRFTYDPARSTYTHTFSAEELASVTLSSLDGVISADAEKLSLGAVGTVTLTAAEAVDVLTEQKDLRIYTSCVLSGEAASNYMLEGIEVNASVEPCRITEVIWGIDGTAAESLAFSFGDTDAYLVTAVGRVGENEYRRLIVKVKGTDVTPDRAELAVYGEVREEPYILYAESPNPEFFVLDGAFEKEVTFVRAECVISASDVTHTQDAEHSPEFYYFPIQNPDSNVPAEVFARIACKFTADGVNFTDAISEAGVYSVHFALHPDDEKRYTLRVEESGDGADGEILVTVLPYRLMAGVDAGTADVIVSNEKGDLGGIALSATLATNVPAELLKQFSVFRSLTVSLTGTEEGDSFKLILPVHSVLLSDANTNALTAADLYLLVDGELKCAKDVYAVTLSEDGSYYTVSGVAASGNALTLTLVMAPEYHISFWATALGISIIVFLFLLSLMILILIGLKLRRALKNGTNPVLTVDTEGDAGQPHPVDAPERLGDADECIEEGLDAMAEALEATVAPETPVEEPSDASAEVAEVMEQTMAEVSEIRLTDDSEERAIAEAERLTEAMAEEKVREFLATEAPADETGEADAEELQAAVAETIGETLEDARTEPASVETMAEADVDAPLSHLRETVDALVVEALAATVQIPKKIREIESADTPEDGDVGAQVARSLDEALRVIGAGGEIKLCDGVDANAIARAVAEAARDIIPKDWSEDAAHEVKTSLIEALKARLLK